jgi:hypothetical protein
LYYTNETNKEENKDNENEDKSEESVTISKSNINMAYTMKKNTDVNKIIFQLKDEMNLNNVVTETNLTFTELMNNTSNNIVIEPFMTCVLNNISNIPSMNLMSNNTDDVYSFTESNLSFTKSNLSFTNANNIEVLDTDNETSTTSIAVTLK